MNLAFDPAAARGRELIAFRAGAQEFAVPVRDVREIRGWTPATPLPHAPAFMRGVINLRGTVLPIVDLAHRLGFPPESVTARHVIIVAEIAEQPVGLLVEAVSDILTVDDDSIHPTPDVGAVPVGGCVEAVLTVDERMLSLLCLDQLLPTPLADAAA